MSNINEHRELNNMDTSTTTTTTTTTSGSDVQLTEGTIITISRLIRDYGSPMDAPPPYSPIDINNSVVIDGGQGASGDVKCQVCFNLISIPSISSRDYDDCDYQPVNDRTVSCSYCNEETPIKAPPLGMCYYRCSQCHCLLKHSAHALSIRCTRPTCNKWHTLNNNGGHQPTSAAAPAPVPSSTTTSNYYHNIPRSSARELNRCLADPIQSETLSPIKSRSMCSTMVKFLFRLIRDYGSPMDAPPPYSPIDTNNSVVIDGGQGASGGGSVKCQVCFNLISIPSISSRNDDDDDYQPVNDRTVSCNYCNEETVYDALVLLVINGIPLTTTIVVINQQQQHHQQHLYHHHRQQATTIVIYPDHRPGN
ncbi:uncharacterized protein LOC128953150 [Oppia nitens]|uniref:uncharacterized protein LOC128953150 n=1 Tax=Oppia nitens TaxID=1686743 RepID=UPI0023DADCA5|nr:uncharacterized protein LOC128953150 [Oppia nitens]